MLLIIQVGHGDATENTVILLPETPVPSLGDRSTADGA